MDVLMVAQYFGDIEQLDKGNNRFVYLASLLSKKHRVEVMTTSFVHARKKQGESIPASFNGFKITALSEPGYKKNVCLKRFYSHRVLADRMEKYLMHRVKPDVIYCAIPSLDCAYVSAKYASKHKIPFIVDVQDLWPEAFEMIFHVPVVKGILFRPMKKKADYIYAKADYIIGVSNTYCARAQKVNEHADTLTVFLGTNLETFDKNAKEHIIERNYKKIVIGYCGTLGHSYDLRCVFDALQIAKSKGYDNIELWVMGRGPLQDVFQQYVEERNLNVKFFGWVPYDQMCGLLTACDICVNPIRKGTAASIINKHADYAAAGIPVINTQESNEYRDLIKRYHCGINCVCAEPESVAEAIIHLVDHESERKQMGANARCMAENLFDRKQTYSKILDVINTLGN